MGLGLNLFSYTYSFATLVLPGLVIAPETAVPLLPFQLEDFVPGYWMHLRQHFAAPGRAALDGPAGQNSPFAAVLLRRLAGKSFDLAGLNPLIRRDLLIETEGRQLMWGDHTFSQKYEVRGPAAAKATVMDLATRMGFRPRDAGPLRNAGTLENLAVLWIHLATQSGMGRQFYFAFKTP